MQLTIILEDRKTEEVFGLAENIHNILVGNPDYIDSNIVLNFDNSKYPQKATVIFSKDDCRDKELIRNKVKEIADIFVGPVMEE